GATLVVEREALGRVRGVEIGGPDLGKVGRESALQTLRDQLQLVVVPTELPASERQDARRGGEPDVAGRLDGGEDAQHFRAEARAKLVAVLVGVAAGVVVAEPEVPGRDVARAALQEEAL